MERIKGVTAAVLAGGRSRRMGADKAMLPWRGASLLAWVVGRMQTMFAQVLVVGGDPARFPQLSVPRAPDALSGEGAIVGVHAALAAAPDPRVFVIGCDAPYPSEPLVRFLASRAPQAAWTCPRTARGIEPLFAVYSCACLEPLRGLIHGGERRLRRLADLVETVFVEEAELRAYDPELRSFINLNTPEDLLAAQADEPQV
jgi:molybdopterin-guanine dinucleotide biosynthesis protein A